MSMPSRLGRYAVRRRIGSGGFATVWLAYDEQLDSPVAVKVLAENWTEDHHVRRRFLEEGRYLRRVESPHVVAVYDAGELDDGRPYLVMSYADQGTLADRIDVEGLTPRQALEVVRQVGAGLTALHRRGILHRDVKPANVLFRTVEDPDQEPGQESGQESRRESDGELRAMVGDLGLGKALEASSRLTMIAGTPSYVAPEQARGEGLDARADQYSLAALAHLLLAGRPPFAHASISAAADPGPAPALSTAERPFPQEVEAVVARGLAPDRADRWPDVAAFVAALDAALAPVLAPAAAAPRGTTTSAADPWLSPDPQLTRPGAAPSPVTRPVVGRDGRPEPSAGSSEPALPSEPSRGRGRSWVVPAAVCLLALAVGAVVGVAGERRSGADPTLVDASGSLQVTVPSSWEAAVARDGWQPPEAAGNDRGAEYAALSVGTGPDWADGSGDGSGQGVFLGVLPGTELPAEPPGHPECEAAQAPVSDAGELGQSLTVVHTGCPGGVVVERVVQVAQNLLLWVQVRSADRATANSVLDSVRTSGI